jgi:hypothetical protein
MKSQIPATHQIKHHKQVFVVLKGKTEVDDIRMRQRLEHFSLSDDILNGIHFEAFFLVDVFQGVQLFALFDYPNLI